MRLALFVLVCSACAAEEATPVDQFPLSRLGLGEVGSTGLTAHHGSGHLWLLAPTGLIESTTDGTLVRTIPYGTEGLTRMPVESTDVGVLSDGSFALTGNGEAYRYDAANGTRSYFCLVPPFVEDWHQENHAVAPDPDNAQVIAAPATFAGTDLLTAQIDFYNESDGAFRASVVIQDNKIVPRGLAVDGEWLWAVEGDKLARLSRTGSVEQEINLIGVEDAAGLTILGDRLVVLDAADAEVRFFDRAALQP